MSLAPFDGPRKIAPQGRLDGASGVDRERVRSPSRYPCLGTGNLLLDKPRSCRTTSIRSAVAVYRKAKAQGLGRGTADGLVRAGHPGLGNGVLPISSGRPRLGLHPLIRKDDKPLWVPLQRRRSPRAPVIRPLLVTQPLKTPGSFSRTPIGRTHEIGGRAPVAARFFHAAFQHQV